MRTRAQTSLCNEVPVGRTGLRSKFRVKVNGSSHEEEKEKDGLRKRKAPELDEAELAVPPVIKKHKRGAGRQQQGISNDLRSEEKGNEEEKGEGSQEEEKNSTFCTVNSEYNSNHPRAEVSETSCSMNSGGDPEALPPKAIRTPLCFPTSEGTIPAKRSPLPLPSAVRSAFPPAVRSALPAVRSALPLPLPQPAESIQLRADEFLPIDNEILEEVDIHGFSSAMQDRSGEDDGLGFDEDGFMGSPWPDDGSLMEMRKRSGPGSRAIYRCSKCLAPKKGHRCPLDSDENRDETRSELVPDLSHKTLDAAALQKSPEDDERSVDELLTEISKQEDDGASPSPQHSEPASSEDAGKGPQTPLKPKPSSELVVREFSVSAKWLLETGILEGHRVRYMPRAGEVLGTGIVRNGVITCTCRQCKGNQGYNASSFEKHVGSTARHPSDFIYLDNGRCLREILEDGSRFRDKPVLMDGLRNAVSKDWDGGCSKCKKSGDLSIICSGKQCLKSFHQDCAGVAPLRMRGWLCPECQQKQGPSPRSSRFRLRSGS